jgi:hypothetical protein
MTSPCLSLYLSFHRYSFIRYRTFIIFFSENYKI